MRKVYNIILILVIILFLSSMIWNWYHPRVVTEFQEVEVPKEIIRIEKVEVLGPEVVKVIEKTKIVRIFKLPDWIVKDKNEQIIAAGKAVCSGSNLSIACLLNVKTGEGKIIQKLDRRSFFGFPNKKTIEAQYGVRQVTTILGSYEFFRIAGFNIKIYGRLDQEGEADAGVALKYNF